MHTDVLDVKGQKSIFFLKERGAHPQHEAPNVDRPFEATARRLGAPGSPELHVHEEGPEARPRRVPPGHADQHANCERRCGRRRTPRTTRSRARMQPRPPPKLHGLKIDRDAFEVDEDERERDLERFCFVMSH